MKSNLPFFWKFRIHFIYLRFMSDKENKTENTKRKGCLFCTHFFIAFYLKLYCLANFSVRYCWKYASRIVLYITSRIKGKETLLYYSSHSCHNKRLNTNAILKVWHEHGIASLFSSHPSFPSYSLKIL